MTISRAHLAGDEEHVRVAAARVTVADGPVACWEMALRDGEDPLDLREGYFYGVSVDAGMACFLDLPRPYSTPRHASATPPCSARTCPRGR